MKENLFEAAKYAALGLAIGSSGIAMSEGIYHFYPKEKQAPLFIKQIKPNIPVFELKK